MSITIAKLLIEIGANSDAARAELTSVGSELQGYGDKMMKTGAVMTAGLSVPLMLLGKQVTTLAKDYQENMNVLGSVTNATGTQMTQLGALAQKLGADLTLPGTSAGDAASAMVELGKSGLSVVDVMGAARGVLELSAAGELSNADAAKIASNALNAFGLAGTEASRVADLLAAGANTSSAEVADLADGFQMASAVFSTSGRSIEDLTAMLAMMANAGIQGSDAGTSLKQMMLSLQAPTAKARSLMEEYGIEIYDANGTMLSSGDIIANFSESLGGMSEAQRNAALAAIFGSDAVRAANVVLMAGEEKFKKTKDAVSEFGAAAKLAEARVEGLPGSLLAMENSLQTLGTNLGNAATRPIAELADVVTDLANGFAALPEDVQENIVRLGMLAIAAGPAMTVFGGITKAAGGMISFLPKAVGGIKDLGAAFSLVKGGAGADDVLGALTVGANGAAFAATAAAASITAMWMAYQKIAALNNTGNDILGTALTAHYQEIIDKGGDATAVMADFNWQMENLTNNQKGFGMAAAGVNWNAIAENNLKEVSAALLQTTDSANEYQIMMMKAYASTNLATSSREWIYADKSGKAYDLLIKKGLALSAADYDLARAEISAGNSAQNAITGITGMGNAAQDSTSGLNALSAEAQTYTSGLDALREAQQSINSSMSEWVQNAASQAQQSLTGLNEEGQRYLEGLKAIDEVMGTNYYQQQTLKTSIEDLGLKYRQTGDLDAYKAGLEKLKDEGLQPFQDQLADVTTRAQELYDKLTNMPSEVLINVNFSVNGEPNWEELGINTGGNPGGTTIGNGGITALPQASGGDWLVTKPTLFLAGEAGTERATFTPAGKEPVQRQTVINAEINVIAQGISTPAERTQLAREIARDIRRLKL